MELEEKYGVALVSHLLAYVTASKHGLTEPEILDLLALDTEVYSNYTQLHMNIAAQGTSLCCCSGDVRSEVWR